MLAKTDRQLWYTKAVLAATDVFSFGWLWASNRDAAKTSRHIECIFVSVGIWDTTAMLAETDGQFVMTNAMLAKTNGHISENGFWMPKSSAC